MARWDPEAAERLRTAAVELFLEHGYENVTVAEIAERAGLTRRTFSRYFADKRDVLFAGSDRLPGRLADLLRQVDPGLPPYAAMLTALTDLAAELGGQVAPLVAQRREVIAGSPELQERGRTKFAEVAAAVAAALVERGADENASAMLADVGVAILRSGFRRWSDDPTGAELAACIRVAADELRGSITPRPA